MALWEVEVNTSDSMIWPPAGCTVIATTQGVGQWGVLIDADLATAATVQSHPNVAAIKPASDGHYPDRYSGYTYEVRGGQLAGRQQRV